jgi:copper chaperone
METLKFKTNIKCGGCIAAVTPALDNLNGVEKWEVDTANPDKILTVETDSGLEADQVVTALKTKGYNAELL